MHAFAQLYHRALPTLRLVSANSRGARAVNGSLKRMFQGSRTTVPRTRKSERKSCARCGTQLTGKGEHLSDQAREQAVSRETVLRPSRESTDESPESSNASKVLKVRRGNPSELVKGMR